MKEELHSNNLIVVKNVAKAMGCKDSLVHTIVESAIKHPKMTKAVLFCCDPLGNLLDIHNQQTLKTKAKRP